MRTKLHKVILSVLLAASVSVALAPAAHANRGNGGGGGGGGYVPAPPYGQNAHPELPGEPNPYQNPAPTVVPVDLPGNTDPGAGLAGGGEPLGSVPSDAVESDVLGRSDTRPDVNAPSTGGVFGGVLSRTGAETLPLARAGLAAITLGLGLVMLSRRRRHAEASA